MMNKIIFVGTSVALVILVDLVTGQGPPGLPSYMSPQLAAFSPPSGGVYVTPSEYEQRKLEKSYEKNFEKTKGAEVIYGNGKEMKYGNKDSKYGGEKDYQYSDKDYKSYADKNTYKYGGKEYEKDYGVTKSTPTPAPGVFSSFSNSMTDAWKSFTNLGRRTRSIKEGGEVSLEEKPAPATTGSYIFFKVPRDLVCSN